MITSLEYLIGPNTFGFVAAALTTSAFLPQVIKTWRTKKAEDVSIVMLLMFITSEMILQIQRVRSYGILKGSRNSSVLQ